MEEVEHVAVRVALAEQRLLWQLRGRTEARLIHPDDLPATHANEVLRRMLRRDFERHRFWLVLDSLGLIASAALMLLPGPNIVVAGSTSISRLHVDYATSGWEDETSLWGILGRLSVGRQWRASRDWSLGLAGELLLGRMGWADPRPPQMSPYIARGFALQFSGAFGAASAAGVVASEPSSGRHAHDDFFLNASARCNPLSLNHSAEYSTPSRGVNPSITASASAQPGTCLGLTKEPT